MKIQEPVTMNENNFFTARLYFTVMVTIAIWSLLAWNYYHGGIPSHHLLADENLPEISNVWGGLLLPVLTWFLLYRIQLRVNRRNDEKSERTYFPVKIFYGFVGALLFGIILSAFFTSGDHDMPGYMLLALFLLALFIPIYQSENILGFVIGMTYTFGAVLPTLVGSILALIGVVLYLLIRPALLYIKMKLAAVLSSNKLKPGL